jgi:hypothetical protein
LSALRNNSSGGRRLAFCYGTLDPRAADLVRDAGLAPTDRMRIAFRHCFVLYKEGPNLLRIRDDFDPPVHAPVAELRDAVLSDLGEFDHRFNPEHRCRHRPSPWTKGLNQVLDLSKIEAGKLELNPQTVQLAPLINEVIGTAGQLAEKNKNRLVVDTQENLGVLTVDPMRRRQILLNLLSNACKFTKQGEVKLQACKVANGDN